MSPSTQRWIGFAIAALALAVCGYAALCTAGSLLVPGAAVLAFFGALIAVGGDARDRSLDT